MLNESRIDIYDYLYNLVYDVVTKNVYSMREPQELTKSDTTDGFIVVKVGDINDESEFIGEAYGWARCYIEAYIPPMKRGRLDFDKYKSFEDSINGIIRAESAKDEGDYYIKADSVLSMEDTETSNADNQFFLFIKSFVVVIDKKE